MSKKKKKTDKAEKKAKVHKELEGFEIKINPLGEITSSYSIDQLNEFLDKNVHDKKLTDKGPGKSNTDDDDNFHVEESQEEDDNPDEILSTPKGKLKPARKKKSMDDDDEDEEEIDEDDEEAGAGKD